MPKFILSGYAKTKLAWLKTWKISKVIGDFIKKYSDVFIALPIVSVLFTTSYWWLRLLDNTAQILDVGNLSILLFNILVLACIFSGAYFYFALFFKDLFSTGWHKKLDPKFAFAIDLILWLSCLITTYFVLTRNL